MYVVHALKMFSKSLLREKTLLMAFVISGVIVIVIVVLVIILSQPHFSFALSVLSKFLLHIKISCFCNILININTTFIYAPCAVCSEQRAHILHTENMHCCHLFVSVYVCLRFDVDRMRIQYGFVIPWISHHLKIAIQYTLCACVYGVRVVDVVCVCAYAHRFYFQISIWFLFAYYNILPVHSFICIAIYLHSFVHLYTLFAVVLLLLSLSHSRLFCVFHLSIFCPSIASTLLRTWSAGWDSFHLPHN